MDSEEARDVKKCRLCLGNFITNETQTGIDILTSKDVQKLVREVYEVQTNGTKENNVEQQQCSTVTATEETTTTKATNTETTTTETAPMDIQTQQLVPVLVDCLKDPLYLKALHPLQVSTDPNDPVPLQYMCSRCYKTFESKEQSEHHNQIMDCAPTCRYCLAKRTPYHYCTEQSKYWSIKDDIEGSSQYVTTYDTITSRSESLVVLAEEAAADVLIAKNDEPKTKHAKLDANRNGRHLSSDRATSDREPSLINISSSEDELLLNIAEPKPAARSSSSSKKKKRRGSKWRSVIQQFLNQIYMTEQHPSAAVSFQAERIECITNSVSLDGCPVDHAQQVAAAAAVVVVPDEFAVAARVALPGGHVAAAAVANWPHVAFVVVAAVDERPKAKAFVWVSKFPEAHLHSVDPIRATYG
uniref:Uncharacterized protein n=1 Tax=Anopheles culicifacies TaxID=139723 RepID=A0A182LWA0_9DIPT